MQNMQIPMLLSTYRSSYRERLSMSGPKPDPRPQPPPPDPPSPEPPIIDHCEDCACPITSAEIQTLRPPFDGSSQLIVADDLFEQELGEGNTALFCPQGIGGVIVLDSAGMAILNQFRTPKSIDEAVCKWGDQVKSFVEASIDVCLLQPLSHVKQANLSNTSASDTLTCWLHLDNDCSLACSYCYIKKTPERMTAVTAKNVVDALIRAAITNGFKAIKLKYAGGEATMNFQILLEAHDYATELAYSSGLHLSAVLLTNGIRMTAVMINQLKERNIRVMVSLDSVEEAHNAQRPFKTQQSVLSPVELTKQTIDRLINQDIFPHISITITRSSTPFAHEAVAYALSKGLTFSLNFVRGSTHALQNLRFDNEQMIAAVLRCFDEIRKQPPEWSILGSVLDRGQLVKPRSTSCGVGRDYVVIDQKGDVAKCHMEIEKTLGSVLTNDPVSLIRNDSNGLQNVSVDAKEGCKLCQWRYWCSGGCAAETFRATGKTNIKSPNCEIYKAIYPEAIKLEGQRLLAQFVAHTNLSDVGT